MNIPNVEYRIITPEVAESMLSKNTHNRRIKARNLEKIKRALIEGRFVLNGDTIRIADDGTIVDGQHRLTAIAQTGVPATLIVVTGVSLEAQRTVDIGSGRSFQDALKIENRVPSRFNETAATVRKLHFWNMNPGKRTFMRPGGYDPSIDELMNTFDQNPAIHESVDMVGPVARNVGARYSVLAFCHYFLSDIDDVDCKDFFEKLATGIGLEAGSPILSLRRRFDRTAKNDPKHMSDEEQIALIFKAWNLYRDGGLVGEKGLRVQFGGAHPEGFPVPA